MAERALEAAGSCELSEARVAAGRYVLRDRTGQRSERKLCDPRPRRVSTRCRTSGPAPHVVLNAPSRAPSAACRRAPADLERTRAPARGAGARAGGRTGSPLPPVHLDRALASASGRPRAPTPPASSWISTCRNARGSSGSTHRRPRQRRPIELSPGESALERRRGRGRRLRPWKSATIRVRQIDLGLLRVQRAVADRRPPRVHCLGAQIGEQRVVPPHQLVRDRHQLAEHLRGGRR